MDSGAVKRLKEKTGKELLWPYILSLLNKSPRYPNELKDLLSLEFNVSLGKILSYVVVYKLEDEGFVKRKVDDKDKRKQMFYITPKGKKELAYARKYFLGLSNRL
jgi:PadR family transcriptional regulator, regulatory protein PadR